MNTLTTQRTDIAAAVAEREQSELDRLLRQPFTPRDLLEDDRVFARLERIAERMAASKMTVPEYLRGNVADCMAIAIQAMLWNMDPFAVAQKTHIVGGRLGYEAQLVNAVLQNSGAVASLPQYEYRGDGESLECRVGFVPAGQRDYVFGEFLMMSSVTTRNSPLWKTNKRQQLGYLQVKNWARAFVPGAILGIYTADELEADPYAPPGDDEPPAKRGPQRKSAKAVDEATGQPGPTSTAGADPDTGEIGAAAVAADRASNAEKKPEAAQTAKSEPQVENTRPVITQPQVTYLRNKLKSTGTAEQAICIRFDVESIEQLNLEQFDVLRAELIRAG